MKRISLTGLTLLLGLALAGANEVPKFKATATNGEAFTQASFTKTPTLLVFMKNGCPMNPKAMPALNKLAKDLGRSVRVVGVMDGDLPSVKATSKSLAAAFPVIADSQGVLKGGFKPKHSLDLSYVAGKKPSWAKVYKGASAATVTEALEGIRKQGFAVPKVSLAAFGTTVHSGCGL